MNRALLLTAVSALLVVALATDCATKWKDYKLTHRRFYGAEEEKVRRIVFCDNLKRAEQYQAQDKGAQYGVTLFSDLTKEEFHAHYLGFNHDGSQSTDGKNYYQPTIKDIPATFDWSEKGAVTPVKNQGTCGSCWAFSAIQNIEGQHFIQNGELRTLSEQQLVDCDKVDQGCHGGLMEQAFTFLASVEGVNDEADYPYTGQDGECKFAPEKAKVKVTGYHNISTDENVIAQSLVELGPLSIGVHADPWQFYFGGISNPWMCGGELDHGVLLVGYGNDKRYFTATDFWKVKNSWGAGWGEKGYIRLVRGKGVCGMNQDITTSVVAKKATKY